MVAAPRRGSYGDRLRRGQPWRHERNAAFILRPWKHRLWSSGFKGEPPEAVSTSVMGDRDAGVGDSGGADVGGDVGADAWPGSGQFGPGRC